VEKVVRETGGKWRVTGSTDRRRVMRGSDYLIITIDVGGPAAVKLEHEIPLKYGIKQCIGDTIGPGGLFKALVTIPVFVDILRDAERLCPDALVLNYTNPMCMVTLSGIRTCEMEMVGLCHSVQHTSKALSRYAGVPYEEMQWECGGINHMAWFTELSHKGQDLYSVLRQRCKDPAIWEQDPVRFEMMLQMGYFVTESSGHFSEYVPYFRKRDDLIARFMRPGFGGETGRRYKRYPRHRRELDAQIRKELDGGIPIPLERSHEYASIIIEAHQTNRPAVIHGNVLNSGLIDNLPQDGVVEVACLVDRNGFQPCRFGPLPHQLAALCASNMNVFELGTTAALEYDREAAIHALMLDPLTAAVCSLDEIRSMAEELFEAEKDMLPEYWSRRS
jgi:alpha-galactosidase